MQQLQNRAQAVHQQARLLNIKKRTNSKVVTVGNYRLGKKIGSGAYGTVHEAFHLQTGHKFAAKVVYFNDNNYEAVWNEVKISQKLSHDNIVKVYEVLQSDNKIYLIMEFCENGQLFEYIRSKGPMNHDLAAKIFMQIYSAVKYLHFKKIAHRDIKTENVLLDSQMNAKLIDFGFSKEYTSEDPMMETFCGSPSYVSPEIIKKQKYNGEKVDVWSLGITLYIMLEAAQPFYGETNADTKFRIINFQWSPPLYAPVEAKQLFDMIFVPSSCRIGLSEMQNSSYFEKYFRQIQRKSRIESRSTQKTERLSTAGECELVSLPGIVAKKRKTERQQTKEPSEEKKHPEERKHSQQKKISIQKRVSEQKKFSEEKKRMNSSSKKEIRFRKIYDTIKKESTSVELKKDTPLSLKLNLKPSKNRFNWKTKSAQTKTIRSDFRQFRVKVTPTKPKKIQGGGGLGIAFFKREVVSSLQQY